MAVSDWSTTAASNTTVGAISIAEGMDPGDVNDAIREMMSQLATWYGDQFMKPVAFAIYNGSTPAVVASNGLSGVAKNGTGDYTFTFSSAEADTDYVVLATLVSTVGDTATVSAKATTDFDITILNSSSLAADRVVQVAVWRSLV